MRLSFHKCNFFNACLCQDKQYIFCKEHSSLHLHSENFFSKVALTDSNGNEVAKLVQTAICFNSSLKLIFILTKQRSTNFNLLIFNLILQEAVVAEWLRRLTRNQIPSGSAGSSPADREMKLFLSHLYVLTILVD